MEGGWPSLASFPPPPAETSAHFTAFTVFTVFVCRQSRSHFGFSQKPFFFFLPQRQPAYPRCLAKKVTGDARQSWRVFFFLRGVIIIRTEYIFIYTHTHTKKRDRENPIYKNNKKKKTTSEKKFYYTHTETKTRLY